MTQLRAEIEDALRQHEKRIPSVDEMRVIVDKIMLMGTSRAPSSARRDSFRTNGRANARRELDECARLTEELLRKIEKLHQPAILALADRGVMLLDKVEPFLRILARDFQSADVSAVQETPNEGRPPKHQQNMLARIVVDAYEEMTGEDSRITGCSVGLVGLVGRIFKLTGLRGDANAAIRAAQKMREP